MIRHKTLSLPNGKIMVNHISCKVCAAHKNDTVNQLKGNARQCRGFHPGNKCGIQTPGMDFFCPFSS